MGSRRRLEDYVRLNPIECLAKGPVSGGSPSFRVFVFTQVVPGDAGLGTGVGENVSILRV